MQINYRMNRSLWGYFIGWSSWAMQCLLLHIMQSIFCTNMVSTTHGVVKTCQISFFLKNGLQAQLAGWAYSLQEQLYPLLLLGHLGLKVVPLPELGKFIKQLHKNKPGFPWLRYIDSSRSVDRINWSLVIPVKRQRQSDGISDIYFKNW